MNIIKHIDQFITKHNLISHGQTIIVGLSGGPDSVFLLHYLAMRAQELQLSLIAAHLDHEWRTTSIRDQQFCKQLCQQLQIPFETQKISELAYRHKSTGSKESDARAMRRYFFASIAEKYHADSIALAQHEDDRTETFFIRLLRGATITGLASIRPQHGLYIRPLLTITKQEILNWLKEQQCTYVIDETNTNLSYLRNRIRHLLIPALTQVDQRATQNVMRAITSLQETELFLQTTTTALFHELSHYDTATHTSSIDITKLLQHDPYMQGRLLMHWLIVEKVSLPASQKFLDEIIRFFKQKKSTEHKIHEQWTLLKKNSFCYIKKEAAVY